MFRVGEQSFGYLNVAQQITARIALDSATLSPMKINHHALRVIRERSGMSLTALAKAVGVSQPHMTNVESGKRDASPTTVRKIADALNMSMLAIVAEEPGTRDLNERLERVLVEEERAKGITYDEVGEP